MGCHPPADIAPVLAHIWLEADDDGWTICTVRDIRSCYASLLSECEISYQDRSFMSTLVDFLSTQPDIEFRAGKRVKTRTSVKPMHGCSIPCGLCVMSLPG
jgi:hypothetical protein